MLAKYYQLFEFTHKLVSVQIEKYYKIATAGVGPDTMLNSELVAKEVYELFSLQIGFYARTAIIAIPVAAFLIQFFFDKIQSTSVNTPTPP